MRMLLACVAALIAILPSARGAEPPFPVAVAVDAGVLHPLERQPLAARPPPPQQLVEEQRVEDGHACGDQHREDL